MVNAKGKLLLLLLLLLPLLLLLLLLLVVVVVVVVVVVIVVVGCLIAEVSRPHVIRKTHTYRVSLEECARLREGVPYAKLYRYNPKHLSPKWNGYGDNGQRSLKL